jgi:ubiquinol-cytochrome c reductase cytochrome c1 subunit
MRALRSLLVGTVLAGLSAATALTPPARAQEAPPAPPQHWSFDRLFGTFDLAAAQRGFQVFSEVCSNCHSAQYLHYRDLSGIGLNAEQIKAVAASVTVPQGLDDQGNPKEGPGTPASRFRAPFPNEVAARAANNGALPPDLSLIVNGREGHADYVHGILTGYVDPPAGFKMQEGMNYNKYFPGHQIAMPKPLSDGQVTYADGTNASVEQMAHDVVTFLAWASEPNMEQRKEIGFKVVIFMAILSILLILSNRKIWKKLKSLNP